MRLFALIFALVGFGAAGKGVFDVWQGYATYRWPDAPGIVLESAVEMRRSGGRRRSRSYRPDITYRYEVDGRTLTGDRYRIGTLSGPRGLADRARRRFPAGASIQVRYRPDRPSESVLVPGPGGGTWLLLVLGTVFGAIGSSLFVAGRSASSAPSRAPRRSVRRRRPRLGVAGTLAVFGSWAGFVYLFVLRGRDTPASLPAPVATVDAAPHAPAPDNGQAFGISSVGRGYSVEGDYRGRVIRSGDTLVVVVDSAQFVGTTRVREPLVVQYVQAQLAVDAERGWSPRAHSELIPVGDTLRAGDRALKRNLRFAIPTQRVGGLDDKMLVFEIGLRRVNETEVFGWTYARSPVGMFD